MPHVAKRFLQSCIAAAVFIDAGLPTLLFADESTATEAGASETGDTNGQATSSEKENGESDGLSQDSPMSSGDQGLTRDLLTGELEKHWTHFSSKEEVELRDVWSIVATDNQRLLRCTGNPRGFLLTKGTYSNFRLTFDWKYVDDAAGNSGVLLFTKNESRLWPTSMQIQLHQPRTGAVFPTGDAKSDNSTEPPSNGLARKVGEWNTCTIVSADGRVKVTINDRSVGEVTGCQPASGHIAIQSEGSETLFRNIRVIEEPRKRTLPQESAKPDSEAPSTNARSEK